jgi:glycosyltransferase involved in cell wall biosynthesis
MKITFVLDTADMAGGTRVVAIYADRLQKRGHRVTVVSTPRRQPTLKDRLRSLKQGRGWPAMAPTGAPPSHLDAVEIDHRVIDRWRPIGPGDVPDADVVVATWWETAEWVNALPRRKGAKAYLIQHHEVLFDGQPRERVAATWRLPLHKIVISKWLKNVARDEYGQTDVSLVPNSVDIEQFNAPPRQKQNRPTVGMLYHTFSKFKACDVALEVVRLVKADIPQLKLVSFGNQPMRAQLPLPDGAVYTQSPGQNQIRNIYGQCDVWLCASHSEGFGLTVLEAMACRCPTVSTRVGGPMDFIADGVNGFLTDVGDVAALARRVREVLEMAPERWRKMSDAAYESARRYTWDDATTSLEGAFQTAMDRSETGVEGRAMLAAGGVLR